MTGRGFSSNYLGGNNNSIVVIFDNLNNITHYVNTPMDLASKHYLNSSNRNIANVLSFRFVSTATSNKSHKNDHHYDFVEQDYLDAQ